MSLEQDSVSPTLDELADRLPPPLLRFVEALARVAEERDFNEWQRRRREAAAEVPLEDEGSGDGLA